jgi:hypothetical protein
MLREAYCDDAACQTTTYEWSKHLKNWRTSTDDKRSGWNSTSRSEHLIAQVTKIIHGNRQLTAQEDAEEVEISIHATQF